MLVASSLYGLIYSGSYFRVILSEQLYDLGYMLSIADPGVWMRPAVKPGGFMYYEYVL